MSGINEPGADVESYQEELADEIGDGGGCSEAWEAISAKREDGADSSTRRSMLSAVAVGLMGIGVGSGSALAGESSDISGSDVTADVVDVEDEELKQSLRRQAQDDSGFEAIRQRLSREGLSSGDELFVKTVVDGEDVQYTYTLQYESGAGGLIWTSNTDDETFAVFSETVKDAQKFTRYEHEGGRVTVSHQEVTREDLREAASDVSTDFEIPSTWPFCTWNTSCVGSIAAAAGATFGCCGTCSSVIGAVGSAATSCICCVGVAIGLVSIECNVCE